ncbi:hypothetical protein C2S51_028075 [Perilla frutescens var. frutescens]|nr:hypothetical protein C2S51_028075 [Perilla frutescens var. frutescens]
MAYNLQSLITILEQILNPKETCWIVTHNKPQLESLLQKAVSLKQNLENSSGLKVESLENRIRDAAEKAEDVIECHMTNQVLSRHGEVFFTFSIPDLQHVMEEFDCVMEQVMESVEGKTKISIDSSWSGAAFLPDHPSTMNVLVGVDEDLMQLKDRLTGQEKLEIVPIVGMGGIGKTKLARNLYEDPLIVSHFDVCSWTTISQHYNVRAILLGLLRRPNEKVSNEITKCTENELKDILYKRLYGRRYLIVLDDMWSTDSWNVIRRCFPHNNNGSRIVLTTRESDVAKDVGAQSFQHKVQLLSKSGSWKLLHQIVFGEEECPAALQGIGRKIAGDCGGLPLAINVIGGLLSKAKRSRDVWDRIAKDVTAAIAETNDDGFSNVLSLSYNHLPNHLKPCFLYMGAFPEDYDIKVSSLIHKWVAEGFLKSNGDKSLEEDAEDYLEALVERNLLLVTRNKTNGKALTYGMHDLLRDLCKRKAGEEKFVHIKNEVTLHYLRRVSFHTLLQMEDVCKISFARSLIYTGRIMSAVIPSLLFFVLRLVRVMDVYGMEFEEFPVEMLQLVNLRYLAFSCNSDIPREISRLLNLQTLIARLGGKRVPSEVLEMSELRHLKLDTVIIIEEGYLNKKIKEKLQKLNMVTCNPLFFKTIPNIKKLGMYCDKIAYDEVVDLSHLHKLETLKCEFDFYGAGVFTMARARLPFSLRKLTLIECAIFDRVLKTLCALPNLEVLKLAQCVFDNNEFEATEGDVFGSLQFLLLEKLDNLVRWRGDETNFPRLRQLVIAFCPVLEEIPSSFGDISTLQRIEVCEGSPSVKVSAREIQEVQQSEFDNYDLQLHIYDAL